MILASDKKIAETSSKGNQEKWFDEKTGYYAERDRVLIAKRVIDCIITRQKIL